ncbi:MAG: TlpA family protein disulfide reductase [Terriglobales bacterium]
MKLVLILVLSSALLPAQAVAGLWVGSAQRGAFSTPIQLQLALRGTQLSGRFLNGREYSRVYHGSFANGNLRLPFDDYANSLTASIAHGVLTGTFSGRAQPELVRLRRVPDIAGRWQIAVHGPKGETEWSLRVTQSGVSVRAVVLRIDGDTGALYGRFHDGVFTVSRFTADGPHTVTLSLLPDGTLQVGRHRARRLDSAPVPLPAVDQPLLHTRMKDPSQPLHFRFPDLAGHMISSTDARFRRKVLLVTVGGSWCPNCHDEAPMLETLYRKYHAAGLDVIDLSFEEAAQLQDPTRLRAFIRDYGLTFPILLAGTPNQLDQLLPQVAGLNCWPTLFFIGRNGLVARIHTGFAGPATGAVHAQLVQETNAFVQKLLAEPR